MPPDPAACADFPADRVDRFAGGDRLCLGFAEGDEAVALAREAHFDVIVHLTDVVGSHGQRVFERERVAEIDDGIDARQSFALADAGEHGFDGTHEFIGIELQRLKGPPIRQNGRFILDFSSFIASRGNGDSFLEHRVDLRVNRRIVDISGNHDTKADVGKFLEKLRGNDEFHVNIPPQCCFSADYTDFAERTQVSAL